MKSKIEVIEFYKIFSFALLIIVVGLIFFISTKQPFNLDGSFYGALLGACTTGGVAIWIMNWQHKKQEIKELKKDFQSLRTTQYFIKNRNSFHSIQAFWIIKKIKKQIQGKSVEEMKNKHLEFYKKIRIR